MVFNFSFNMVIYYDHDNRKGPLPSLDSFANLAPWLFDSCGAVPKVVMDQAADHIWGESSGRSIH